MVSIEPAGGGASVVEGSEFNPKIQPEHVVKIRIKQARIIVALRALNMVFLSLVNKGLVFRISYHGTPGMG